MSKTALRPRFASRLRRHGAALAFALALAGIAPQQAAAQTVAAMVNGDPITSYDVDQRAKFNQMVSRKTANRKEVLDELINEKIKIQTGRRYKLELTDADIESSYAEMGKRMNLSPQQLTQLLEKGGVDPGTLKSRIRADMVWQSIVRGKFQSAFQFRDKDVLAAIETRKKDDKDKEPTAQQVEAQEYVLRPILFIVPKGAAQGVIDSRRAEAEALRNRFQGCESGLPFARALKDVAVRDQIVRSSADLPPSLKEILERTGVGRLTSPEATPGGIEVFAICAKRETKADAPAMRQARQELFAEQFNAKSKRFLDELRRSALIEIR